MKVKQLQLTNYGRFSDLTIDFAPTKDRQSNVTVIVGNNGAGKSQILQGLVDEFRFFISNIKKVDEKYYEDFYAIDKYIDLDHIKKSTKETTLALKIRYKDELNDFLKISQSKDGSSYSCSHGISDLIYKNLATENVPLLVFYPTSRFFNIDKNHSLNLPIDNKANSEAIEVYDNFANTHIDFNGFVEWFKYREDIENADIRRNFDILLQNAKHGNIVAEDAQSLISRLASLSEQEGMHSNNRDKQLACVRSAISNFIDDFTNIWVDRGSMPVNLNVAKDGETLNLNQLSQGEKSLLALIGDMAKKLAILNPHLENPLEGEGVVMIDEVDLHLHPKWQHDLVDKLVTTFPNVQFILTTHSPHIISDYPDILVYALDDGELTKIPNVYGEDVNSLLTQVFDVSIRDPKIAEQFDEVRRSISSKEFAEAESLITALAKIVPKSSNELLKCRLLLAQAQLAEQKAES